MKKKERKIKRIKKQDLKKIKGGAAPDIGSVKDDSSDKKNIFKYGGYRPEV